MSLLSLLHLFGEIRQPRKDYLVIPEVSSENRQYIPIGFLPRSVVPTNKLYTFSGASLYHFGILASAIHMGWIKSVAGRLKSDFQYSAGIVYNNFPWPRDPSETQVKTIEEAAQDVLDARAKFPNASLADLYDPIAMPRELRRAHEKLDHAADAAYASPEPARRSNRDFKSEAERVAFIFELYQQYTSLLPVERSRRRTPHRTSRSVRSG
ncbi:MAG: type IIL restriction-modification enzyme MmeI [Burkholderiales bacterium]